MIFQSQTAPGMAQQIVLEEPGQEIFLGTAHAPQPQKIPFLFFPEGKPFFIQFQHVDDHSQEPFSFAGEFRFLSPLASQQQRVPQFLFQPGQPFAEGGLGQKKIFGGLCHVPGPAKIPEQVK